MVALDSTRPPFPEGGGALRERFPIARLVAPAPAIDPCASPSSTPDARTPIFPFHLSLGTFIFSPCP